MSVSSMVDKDWDSLKYELEKAKGYAAEIKIISDKLKNEIEFLQFRNMNEGNFQLLISDLMRELDRIHTASLMVDMYL